MKISSKLKLVLKSILSLQMGEISTDKAVLYWDGEGDLKEGDEVFVRGGDPEDNAELQPAADGEYTGRDQVANYLRMYRRLPRNFITKAQARSLGWQGGPLERYAPGKSIGGDHFGNYENKLPRGRYRECDIDTRGKPRGAKRLVYSEDIRSIYYTGDHYRTFEKVP